MLKPQIIRITSENQAAAVNVAKDLIKAGKVIALPTDTVYGLACDASNPLAVKELYDIKGRDDLKPVAICVADLKSLKHWGDADHLSDELLNILLPGPVTIVVDKSKHLNNPNLNTGTHKIGIRIPKFPFIRDLCEKLCNRPLALTSANRSSEPSTLDIEEFQVLWKRLPGIFDIGRIGITEENRLASTVVDLSEPGTFSIIREGIAGHLTRKSMERFSIRELSN